MVICDRELASQYFTHPSPIEENIPELDSCIRFNIHAPSLFAMPSFTATTQLSIMASKPHKIGKYSCQVVTCCYLLKTSAVKINKYYLQFYKSETKN